MAHTTGLSARGIAVMSLDPVASELTKLALGSSTGPYCCYKSTKNCVRRQLTDVYISVLKYKDCSCQELF